MNNEVIDLLVKQNSFIQQFAQSNDINDHISVFAVKPIRAQNGVYQAFARISKVLRQGFSRCWPNQGTPVPIRVQ